MYFGAHVSASGGIDKAAERAIEMKADAVQVFTQSPRLWRPTNHKQPNIDRFRQLCDDNGVRTGVAHAIYLINLASTDPEIYRKSVETLVHTVTVSEQLGLDAVVFHVGSHRAAGLDSCIDRVMKGIDAALQQTENTWLLMENSAGGGGTIGRSLDELARLLELAERHPRLGVCVDTCHWYVSGTDVTDRSELDKAIDELDQVIGLDRLRVLHINDSRDAFGSNRDRHANIGEGTLGDQLGVFLSHPKLQGLPAIIEVPGEGHGPTAEQVAKVRQLHASVMPAHR